MDNFQEMLNKINLVNRIRVMLGLSDYLLVHKIFNNFKTIKYSLDILRTYEIFFPHIALIFCSLE